MARSILSRVLACLRRSCHVPTVKRAVLRLPEAVYFREAGRLEPVQVGAEAGLNRPLITNRTAAWADFDGDGQLDVFIMQVGGLYKNNGDGTFTDVTAAAGVTNSENAQAATWGEDPCHPPTFEGE